MLSYHSFYPTPQTKEICVQQYFSCCPPLRIPWSNVEAVLQSFYSFTEHRKSLIEESLKYKGGCMREAGTLRWRKLSYRLKTLSDDILSLVACQVNIVWKRFYLLHQGRTTISTNHIPQNSQGLNHQPKSIHGGTHGSSHICSRRFLYLASMGGEVLGSVEAWWDRGMLGCGGRRAPS
jgi:hypothetical protein